MSKKPKIRVESDDGLCKIFVDGHELKGVRRFKLEQDFADAPRLTVDINAFDITVDSPCILYHEGLGELEVSLKPGKNKKTKFIS